MGERRRKTVLVIEDDVVLSGCLAEFLEAEGYSVQVARDGQHGLDILRHSALPVLILLDLMMPIKDGAAFRLEQCRDARLADIPTIVMSADAHAQDNGHLFETCSYISKPLDITRLLQAVKRRCG